MSLFLEPHEQAERREAEADRNAICCDHCDRKIYDGVWRIGGETLCEKCARNEYYFEDLEDV